jgi:hypothetical protein
VSLEELKRDRNNDLSKYMFYFERFNNHDKAEKHANKLVEELRKKVNLLKSIKHYDN